MLQAQTINELNTITKDEIKLVFTNQYNSDDLTAVKNELKSLDIKLTYTSIQFNDDGYLKQISARIEYPDGVAGSFTSADLSAAEKGVGPGFKWKKDEYNGK